MYSMGRVWVGTALITSATFLTIVTSNKSNAGEEKGMHSFGQ